MSRYRKGDDGAVPAIESWTREDLLAAAGRLWRLDERERASREWDSITIAAASLLHLRVMARHPDAPFRQALHMKIARQHLAGLRRDPAVAALTSKLTLVLAIYLQSQLKVEDLQSLFDEIPDGDGSDAGLLFGRGAMHELFASRRLAAARQAGLLPDAGQSLREAERALRRAVAASPHDLDARLHLGRVVIMQGRPEEGIKLLEPVRQAPLRDVRYLANLFLGEAHERAGRRDAAAQAFSQAAAQSSCGRAAAVARAQLAFRQSGWTAAAEVLRPALASDDGCADAWATYDFGPVERLATLTDELERTVRR